MLFSIITVSFNSEKTIERTILSVLNQTFKDFEYIIIDGNSKDETLSIITKYEKVFHGRLKWVSEPDKGIYDAMNKGIKMSNGEIIGIVNSDDWLELDALEKISNCYICNNRKQDTLYCGWINFHYLDGKMQLMRTSHDKLVSYASRFELGGIRHPATFVPKYIYDRLGLFDTKMKVMADCDFILRCYFNGITFYYSNQVLSNMSDGGVSNKYFIKAFNDYKLILNKNSVNFFKYTYLVIFWLLKYNLKIIIPSFLLYKYRSLSKA